ncbi:hypothetical protein F5878DRAFT_429724 [Lentinula raphanica]|uniref:C2H2-type domain-containing protein n=1 Tax=Lentinula raphanica TaxID=153919 RepID=A0AA38UBW1_9AGAR|nr:hypothetical protein F5878DRAFT_429724 [Lentinula raphanica]
MARLNTEAESSGKKETSTTRKKAAAKAKNAQNGVWPCDMNGCNKQFAREADLKRHQRTTKLHSVGGFACPQCEANFTRTDALRRHQKSRHNGALFDPMEPEPPSGSSQNGGALTPASKSNGREAVMPETTQGTPSASGPATGQLSYYHESVTSGSCASPPLVESVAEWSHGHAWPNGKPPPPLGQTAYMYVALPSYRQGNTSGTSSSRSSSSSHSQPNESEQSISPDLHTTRVPSVPAPIPPLPPPMQLVLNSNTETTQTPESVSEHQCSQEGFTNNDMLKHSRTWSMSDETASSGIGTLSTSTSSNATATSSSSSSSSSSVSSSGESLSARGGHVMLEHGYGSRLVRPEPLETILTENGEPMLDPAELLTQESLASPEPSY